MRRADDLAAGLTVITVGGLLVGSAAYTYLTPFEKEITVRKKYQRTKTGDHVFMFQDEHNNHYRTKNIIWHWKWYSTELWSELEENQKYLMKGYGVRFGPLGLYPNVIEAKKVQMVVSDKV